MKLVSLGAKNLQLEVTQVDWVRGQHPAPRAPEQEENEDSEEE